MNPHTVTQKREQSHHLVGVRNREFWIGASDTLGNIMMAVGGVIFFVAFVSLSMLPSDPDSLQEGIAVLHRSMFFGFAGIAVFAFGFVLRVFFGSVHRD